MRQECILIIGHEFKTDVSYGLVQIYKAKTFEFEKEPMCMDGFGGDMIGFLKKGYHDTED
jgi:hypothetical protein